VVGSAVVVGPVTGGWVVVAPKAENASVIVVVPAVAGAWALAGPRALVGLLTAPGTVAEVGVDEAGKVVGSRGPVAGGGADLGAGSAGTFGSARPVPGVAVTVGVAGWPRPPRRPGRRW